MTALLVADLFGVPALGEIFGVLALPATVGAALGGVGAGILFDWTGRYDGVFLACMSLLGLGALLMIALRAPEGARP